MVVSQQSARPLAVTPGHHVELPLVLRVPQRDIGVTQELLMRDTSPSFPQNASLSALDRARAAGKQASAGASR